MRCVNQPLGFGVHKADYDSLAVAVADDSVAAETSDKPQIKALILVAAVTSVLTFLACRHFQSGTSLHSTASIRSHATSSTYPSASQAQSTLRSHAKPAAHAKPLRAAGVKQPTVVDAVLRDDLSTPSTAPSAGWSRPIMGLASVVTALLLGIAHWVRSGTRTAASPISLAMFAASGSKPAAAPNAPKRVAIVGAGPGGLALALALSKLPASHRPLKIDMYDRRDDPFKAGLGGGVQLNGGAQVLDRLGLGAALRATGQECKRVLSRTVDGETLLDIDIAEVVKRFGVVSQDLIRKDGAGLHSFTIMRDELQRVLIEALPKDLVEFHPSTTLQDLTDSTAADEYTDEGNQAPGVMCKFEDGRTMGPYDLVVAADGINSAVRQVCISEQPKSKDSGIRIQFGVGPEGVRTRPEGSEGELHQWFADGLYMLTGTYGAGPEGERREMVVAVFAEPAATIEGNENANWEVSEVQDDCKRRMTQVGAPQSVIDLVNGSERFFEVAVRYCDPFQPWGVGGFAQQDGGRTRRFRAGHVVLLGDAAHAMPPFLGQGANQAIQDAFCLAEQLRQVDQGVLMKQTMESALQWYEVRRKPNTTVLLLESRFLGWLETGTGVRALLRDQVFRVLGQTGIASAVYVNGAVPRV